MKLNKSTDYFDLIVWRFGFCTSPHWEEVTFEGNKSKWVYVCSLLAIWGVYWKVDK